MIGNVRSIESRINTHSYYADIITSRNEIAKTLNPILQHEFNSGEIGLDTLSKDMLL